MNVEPAVWVEGLTKCFGDFVAVDGVTFSVAKGEIFGFLGPNGSGKTTTIRMLCGLLPPTAGRGRVLGYDIAARAEMVKERIGYMSQRFSLYEDLTARENLEFFAGLYRVPLARRDALVADTLAVAGLHGREKDLVAHLATGWRQRLALGCATVHRPPVLFLDEPTAGVDPAARRQFWDVIYDLAEAGVTVFVTTHYMDEAEHCHKVALMYEGKLIAWASPTDLRREALRGWLWEIECDAPWRAADELREMDRVVEATAHGLTVHAEVEDPTWEEGDWHRALDRLGFRARHIRRVAPSLEDAFVSLIGRAGKRE